MTGGSTPLQGRTDAKPGVFTRTEKANLAIGAFIVWMLATWHPAIALTASGVGFGDVQATLNALFHLHPIAALPGTPPSLVLVLVVWLGGNALCFAAYLLVLSRLAGRRAKKLQLKGFANSAVVRGNMGEARARERAKQARPGLSDQERASVDVTQIGFRLGDVQGQEVILGLEDFVAVVAPTGAGKSRDLMIPAALDAPGALIVTSTRTDILDVVATKRARMGRVWVFDPLGRTGWPEPMVWNPVAGCADARVATSRALAFATGLGADDGSTTNSGFFRANSAAVLRYLLHAADLDGRPMSDVIEWAVNLTNGAEVPQEIIRESTSPQAEPAWPGMLASLATGAEETVSSTRMTLQQSIDVLATRDVARWVTPAEGVAEFDSTAFVNSTDTLFLIADDSASSNVAPLCSMLLQDIVDTVKREAVRRPGSRIDPPIRLVGDEIANVAPVPKFPSMATDTRGYGMQLMAALQSFTQARIRWSADGASTLLGNMAAEILLPGHKDPETLERYSTLVGDVRVAEWASTYDPITGRETSGSSQLSDRRALRPEEARMMKDRQGLLIYGAAEPVIITMRPWFERPDGARLERERQATEARRIAAATAEVLLSIDPAGSARKTLP
ncbi:type IV secretory system conjugative DNA transfer family protein [Kineococcus sp. R86509]|uniref:type IV secretory system conjugative DNA transfer family protein n=1 Tax=Kineococcus sp. R86509 TaxID=3093851 RepID=UPI0036D2E098